MHKILIAIRFMSTILLLPVAYVWNFVKELFTLETFKKAYDHVYTILPLIMLILVLILIAIKIIKFNTKTFISTIDAKIDKLFNIQKRLFYKYFIKVLIIMEILIYETALTLSIFRIINYIFYNKDKNHLKILSKLAWIFSVTSIILYLTYIVFKHGY